MFTRAPIRLPTGWLKDYGYPGGRRFVALYWGPCGDRACFDDGVYGGTCDDRLYRALLCRPEVARWLVEHGVQLGDANRLATHWLVADGRTGDVYAAVRRAAASAVRTQSLRPPGRRTPSGQAGPSETSQARVAAMMMRLLLLGLDDQESGQPAGEGAENDEGD